MRTLALVLATCALPLAAQERPAPAPAAAMTPEAAALAGWDEEVGIWFPPDAPRQVYLDRSDPQHNLIRDAQKAFEASPGLAQAVAAMVNDPRRQVDPRRLPGHVKQLVTMFHMLVIGYLGRQDEQARQAVAWREREATFERSMDLPGARALPFDERLERLEKLRKIAEETGGRSSEDQLRDAFAMLALRPQSEWAMFHLLSVDPYRGTLPEPRFQAFLRRILDREGADGMPETWRYRMASRNLTLLRNDLVTARDLSKRLLAAEELKQWETDNRLVAAYLDRLAGDPASLRAALAECKATRSSASGGSPEVDAESTCRELIHSLSAHLLELLGEKAPRGIVELMVEEIAARPAEWAWRTDCIRHVEVLDAARARALAEDLLQLPASITPLGTRLEAFETVGRTSTKLGDFARSVGAWDRYLANLRYQPPSKPADLWARLAAVPEGETGPLPAGAGWSELVTALDHKVEAGIAAGDAVLAMRTLEEMVAVCLALANSPQQSSDELWKLVDAEGASDEDRRAMKDLLEEENAALGATSRAHLRDARRRLRQLGNALLARGRRAEATTIARYLLGNAGGDHNLIPELIELKIGADQKGEPLTPADSPWPSASGTTGGRSSPKQ